MVKSFSYGDFSQLCQNIPSFPVCSLFLRQILNTQPPPSFPRLLALPNRDTDPDGFRTALSDAGVGIKSICALPRMAAAGGLEGFTGNTANIVVCALSVIFALSLAALTHRRQAAVARIEMMAFFTVYAATCLFQLLSTGSFIRQGANALMWVTSIHLALVVVLFFVLAWTGFLALQVLEDGVISSFAPLFIISIILFIGTVYLGLDTAFSITNFFKPGSDPSKLHNSFLFTLLIVFSGLMILIFTGIMAFVVLRVLRERKPLIYFTLTLIIFVLSQGAYWGLSQRICINTHSKIDGSWLATLLESLSVYTLWLGWKAITESEWGYDNYSIGSGAGYAGPGA